MLMLYSKVIHVTTQRCIIYDIHTNNHMHVPLQKNKYTSFGDQFWSKDHRLRNPGVEVTIQNKQTYLRYKLKSEKYWRSSAKIRVGQSLQ